MNSKKLLHGFVGFILMTLFVSSVVILRFVIFAPSVFQEVLMGLKV